VWEEELQSIVEKQQFLNHQGDFFADLIEDRKAVAEINEHVEKVILLRRASGALRPPCDSMPPPFSLVPTGLLVATDSPCIYSKAGNNRAKITHSLLANLRNAAGLDQ